MRALFDIDTIEGGKIESAIPDIANTWRVVFNSQDVAMKALEICRTKKLEDTPVSAYLKAEHLSKLLFNY